MKKCPSCGYQASTGAACGVCGRDLGAVPELAVPKKSKDMAMPFLAAALLACAAVAFFFFGRGGKPEPVAAVPGPSEVDEFGYEGALYALERMEGLKFLPEEDKLRVLPLLESSDGRVAFAAVKLAGKWLTESAGTPGAEPLLDALIRAALSGAPELRKQAAMEIAAAAAYGMPLKARARELRAAASSLVKAGDAELVSAGYFLASAAAFNDFSGEMLQTLRYDPSSQARLYSACALARLGDAEGYRHLAGLAGGADEALAESAIGCLAYSSVPGSGKLLSAVAAGRQPAAGWAKNALIFRGQLAIIKK